MTKVHCGGPDPAPSTEFHPCHPINHTLLAYQQYPLEKITTTTIFNSDDPEDSISKVSQK